VSDVYLGIDLGGTRIKAAAVSGQGELLGRAERDTPATEGVDVVVDAMIAAGNEALSAAGVETPKAAGIGAPGPMNWQSGIVYSPPNLEGWKDVPLADLMRDRLGVPCYVDNDANVACYGEFSAGAGSEVDSLCMLTLGTGVGGGIVVFDTLLRGIDGTAAEIGHMTVVRDGRKCGCGAHGCLETYASVTGMVRTAREGLERGAASTLRERGGPDGMDLSGEMISREARNGDAYARWVVEETGTWIGIGVANLINLLNPEMIVLGGGMISAGPMLIDSVRETATRNAFAVPARRAQIVPSRLGGDAGVVGAAAAARDRLAGG